MSVELETRPLGELAPTTMYEVFAAMARDTTIPVERFAQLLELRAQEEKREAERAFIAAMTRLQPRLPRIVKRGKIEMGSKGAIAFAKFEDIDEIVRPLLTDEGFTVTFGSEATDKGVLVVCTIKHSMGHSESSRMQLPADAGPGRNGLQALGSALQYARRYLYSGMLNLVMVGEDDDANRLGFVSEQQTKNILDAIKRAGLEEKRTSKFLDFAGAKVIGEIKAGRYSELMEYLGREARKKDTAPKEYADYPDPFPFPPGSQITVAGSVSSRNAAGSAWEPVK